MSDVYESEDEAQEQTGKNPVRARMRELESEVKTLREKAAEAEKLQKELAFSKAGIPMDAPMAKYFIKGYEGSSLQKQSERLQKKPICFRPKPQPLRFRSSRHGPECRRQAPLAKPANR